MLELAEGVLRQQRRDLSLRGAHQSALEQPEQQGDDALRVFEQHVARKAVRRQHVTGARERVARLHAADEMEGLLPAHQRAGGLRLLIALGVLHADV